MSAFLPPPPLFNTGEEIVLGRIRSLEAAIATLLPNDLSGAPSLGRLRDLIRARAQQRARLAGSPAEP